MDTFTPFQEIELKPVFFQASRYEEYKDGRLIDSGMTAILVRITKMPDNRIKCIIGNNNLYNKLMSCEFDKCISLHDRLLMLSSPLHTNANVLVLSALKATIGTTCESKTYQPIEPVVGSIYTDNEAILKMSFTTSNPERLIELYR